MPKKFTTYAESPLALFLVKALKQTATIRDRYKADLDNPDTQEKSEARDIVISLEKALALLHQTILPRFDQGQTLTFLLMKALMGDFNNLVSLIKAVKTRENSVIIKLMRIFPQMIKDAQPRKGDNTTLPTATLLKLIDNNKRVLYKTALKIPGPAPDRILADIKATILDLKLDENPEAISNEDRIFLISQQLILKLSTPKHPMVYELMMAAKPLIESLPEQLESLIPFFDHSKIIKQLSSGILGPLLRLFGSFKISLVDSGKPEITSYDIVLSVGGEKQKRNLRQDYLLIRDRLLSLLDDALRNYQALHDLGEQLQEPVIELELQLPAAPAAERPVAPAVAAAERPVAPAVAAAERPVAPAIPAAERPVAPAVPAAAERPVAPAVPAAERPVAPAIPAAERPAAPATAADAHRDGERPNAVLPFQHQEIEQARAPIAHNHAAAINQRTINETERVTALLADLETTHANYAAKLHLLIQSVAKMKDYGVELRKPQIIQLAHQLKKDIYSFIINHGTVLPDIKSYKAFSETFHAKLHSEDHLMREEGKNWRYIVANIALALFLIPKLIYSKITTGRFSFFFEETPGTRLVSAVEESAQALISR